MMTCKEVSTLVSTGNIDTAPLVRRMTVRLHVAMCRHCRTFRRQVIRLARAAHLVSDAIEAEPSPDFEGRILDRLDG